MPGRGPSLSRHLLVRARPAGWRQQRLLPAFVRLLKEHPARPGASPLQTGVFNELINKVAYSDAKEE